ncbi:MAG: DUF1801 domain-containing protein [Pseudomonadota bacterium]
MTDATLFKKLTDLFRPYEKDMQIKTDTDDKYYIEEALSSDKLQMFASVQIKKNYISVYLMPVYCQPELLEGISDDLKKRMQGKSCFNFTQDEQVPWAEFKALIKQSRKAL